MAKKIYGIDPEGKVTPLMVRDAILECFFQAHCADSGVGAGEEDVGKSYCSKIVRTAFEKIGGDFSNPTKEDIIKVMGGLREFARNFRDSKLVEENYAKIMQLVNKIKES
jgi:hypothetical protein